MDLTKKVALPIAMRLVRAMRRRPWYTDIIIAPSATDALHRLGVRIDTVATSFGPTSSIGPRHVETAATVAERRTHSRNAKRKRERATQNEFDARKARDAAAREAHNAHMSRMFANVHEILNKQERRAANARHLSLKARAVT